MMMMVRILAILVAVLFLAAQAQAQIVYGSGLPSPVVNGECIIGAGGVAVWGSCSGSGTAVTSVTGTTGQITASPTTGDVILTLPATITEVLTFSGANAYGTPASITLTNGTGLPLAGLTGAGTGVVTALGVNVGSAGAVLVNGGALGTPSSGTLTNATGLPVAGLSNLGANVGTFLITPSGANLASALTTALPESKGGTGQSSLGAALNADFTPTSGNCITGNGGSTAWVSAACPGGGGGSAWDITDGTHTVTSVTGLTVGNGFLIGGSAGAATLDATNTLNSPTDGGSHSYTLQASDAGKDVVLAATFTALVLPQATSSFGDGFSAMVCTLGAATATSTTSTVNGIAGATGLKTGANQCGSFDSVSGNWIVSLSVPTVATQDGSTFLKNDGTYGAPSGSGTVNSGTSGQLAYYASSTNAVSGAASATISAGALSLGASGTLGTVTLGNATSGTAKITPATGALGTTIAQIPAWNATGNLAAIDVAQTWTAAQTHTVAAPQLILGVNTSTLGAIKMFGNTSGDVTIEPNAVAGTSTIMKVPAWGATGNVAAVDVAQTFSAAQTFGETHGTTYAPTLTSNNYNATTTDCGKVLLIPTGTTPTVTMPNVNAACTIVLVQASATQFTVQAASGGTIHSVNSYTKSKAQYAVLFLTIIVPSASVAEWTLGGDGA
jgi:hypothetical protein